MGAHLFLSRHLAWVALFFFALAPAILITQLVSSTPFRKLQLPLSGEWPHGPDDECECSDPRKSVRKNNFALTQELLRNETGTLNMSQIKLAMGYLAMDKKKPCVRTWIDGMRRYSGVVMGAALIPVGMWRYIAVLNFAQLMSKKKAASLRWQGHLALKFLFLSVLGLVGSSGIHPKCNKLVHLTLVMLACASVAIYCGLQYNADEMIHATSSAPRSRYLCMIQKAICLSIGFGFLGMACGYSMAGGGSSWFAACQWLACLAWVAYPVTWLCDPSHSFAVNVYASLGDHAKMHDMVQRPGPTIIGATEHDDTGLEESEHEGADGSFEHLPQAGQQLLLISSAFSGRCVVLALVFIPFVMLGFCMPYGLMQGDITNRQLAISFSMQRGWAYHVGSLGMTSWAMALLATTIRYHIIALIRVTTLPEPLQAKVKRWSKVILVVALLVSLSLVGVGVFDRKCYYWTHVFFGGVAFPFGLSLIYLHWARYRLLYKSGRFFPIVAFWDHLRSICCALAVLSLLGMIWSEWGKPNMKWLGIFELAATLTTSMYWSLLLQEDIGKVDLHLSCDYAEQQKPL